MPPEPYTTTSCQRGNKVSEGPLPHRPQKGT